MAFLCAVKKLLTHSLLSLSLCQLFAVTLQQHEMAFYVLTYSESHLDCTSCFYILLCYCQHFNNIKFVNVSCPVKHQLSHSLSVHHIELIRWMAISQHNFPGWDFAGLRKDLNLASNLPYTLLIQFVLNLNKNSIKKQ